jgi:copper homeostasis protein
LLRAERRAGTQINRWGKSRDRRALIKFAMTTAFFELCAESREAARAAETGGADRIELCSELERGGLTPGLELMHASIRAVTIPAYVLIRPRSGDFVFSAEEFALMRTQIAAAKEAGASGVAVGVLLADGGVDVERTRELVELARPMAATFHRAFDETPDLSESLERVIETGAEGLLTSGGAREVLGGAESISALLRQAGGRIHIIAGGGLQLETLTEVVRRSGAFSLHGSLKRRNGHGVKIGAAGNGASANGAATDGIAANQSAADETAALEADVREAVRLLRREVDERSATRTE